jgi:hypothetical protein
LLIVDKAENAESTEKGAEIQDNEEDINMIDEAEMTEAHDYSETILSIFSNLRTSENYPKLGDEKRTIEYICKYVDMPFENMELTSLELLINLLDWNWGFEALYKQGKFVTYILDRGNLKMKEICEKKFELVEKTVRSMFFTKTMKMIDDIIGEQLEVFYKGGIYGSDKGGAGWFLPIYSTMNS